MTTRELLEALWSWFWAWALGVSVRIKIISIALGMVFLLGLTLLFQVRQTCTDILTRDLQDRGTAIGRDVAARSADLILSNNLFALHQLVHDALNNNPDVRYVFVLGPRSEVLAHTFEIGVPPDLLHANSVGINERAQVEPLDSAEGVLYDVAVPVPDGRTDIVRIGMSTRGMGTILASRTRDVVLTTAVISLVGVLVAFLLTELLVRPIMDLLEATRAVAAGDFSQRAKVWSRDEIGQLTSAFNGMTGSLQRMQVELQRKEAMRLHLLEKIMTAQEEERKRVARELHDETGQALTSMMVRLELLSGATCLEEAKARIGELREGVNRTLDEVHRLSLELRPSVLDDMGLVAALQRYVDDLARSGGLDIDYQALHMDERRLPPAIETTLYRIVQEALTNVVRHAHARNVSVVLELQPASVQAIIEDDGVGFDAAAVMGPDSSSDRLGLFGMRERAALLGGSLAVESSPGRWTTVYVDIPLSNEGLVSLSLSTDTNS